MGVAGGLGGGMDAGLVGECLGCSAFKAEQWRWRQLVEEADVECELDLEQRAPHPLGGVAT